MDRDLQRLLADKALDDYEALAKEPKFNAFDVLRYSDYEIRHSNVLAWLLTPGGTHGAGDAFVMEFVQCLNSKQNSRELADLALYSGFATEDVRVERELDRVDVTVFFEKEPRLLLAIENKLSSWARDQATQVNEYEQLLRKKYREKYRIQSVLLTASREGNPKTDTDYLHVSWHEVRDLVVELLDRGSIRSGEVQDFVRQYLEIVERNVLGLGASADCFGQLVKRHAPVLERLLVEGLRGVPSDRGEAVDQLLAEYRHRPRELRDAVRERLQSKGFETSVSSSRETTYWVNFWDGPWEKKLAALGMEEQGWWLDFTRQGVTVKLGGAPVQGKKRRTVGDIMQLMGQIPVEGTDQSRFPLEFEERYPYFYRRELVPQAAFANKSPAEVRELAWDRIESFLASASSDYQKIGRYFEVLAFTPSPSYS